MTETTETGTKRITQLVLSENAAAQTLEIDSGTTLGEIAAQLGMPNPENVRAIDEMKNPMTADTKLTEDGTINFLERVSGA